MMSTTCGPSAVPTGGAGVACPAGICSLTNPVAFLAIVTPVKAALSRQLSLATDHAAPDSHCVFSVVVVSDVAPRNQNALRSVCLQLQVVQLHARGPAKEADRHAHLALVRIHFFHRATEVAERTFRDRDGLPH